MTEQPPKPPFCFIQWKGTDACLDLHCTCGVVEHFDGFHLYAIICKCGREYRMPEYIHFTEIERVFSKVETVQKDPDDPTRKPIEISPQKSEVSPEE